jgi:hypothetical protein
MSAGNMSVTYRDEACTTLHLAALAVSQITIRRAGGRPVARSELWQLAGLGGWRGSCCVRQVY